ncbi:FxLD family lanthipeptide [Streptomyces sp. NBC_00237]|uniref:FxLD family lanthipeptide n=1 Tax=Streptomyces sp. NBC_00237 TaxID=2975687 RepID=UPI002253C21A|nr:FxLD family lanthipeptide [Streptomyces sp. NBC_00237]MCX5206723.1 FxLD family lanthipeptide [Streptomyces sp. NBC_00237]
MDGTTSRTTRPAPDDAFDLDISVLESGDGSASLINLTDDGCKPSCKGSCATNVA